MEVLARTVQASSLTHTNGNFEARGQRMLNFLGKEPGPGRPLPIPIRDVGFGQILHFGIRKMWSRNSVWILYSYFGLVMVFFASGKNFRPIWASPFVNEQNGGGAHLTASLIFFAPQHVTYWNSCFFVTKKVLVSIWWFSDPLFAKWFWVPLTAPAPQEILFFDGSEVPESNTRLKQLQRDIGHNKNK